MRVVAFTGMPGAGKSEAVGVAKERGIPVVRMGDHVFAETKRRGLELLDANIGKVATEMRQTHGRDYWARVTAEAILRDLKERPLVLIDGVRNHEEVDAFRNALGHSFELVAITAPPDTRADRLLKRGRSDDAKARTDVEKRDERELGWGIATSIALADHVIVNEGDLNSFKKQVAKFLDSLIRAS